MIDIEYMGNTDIKHIGNKEKPLLFVGGMANFEEKSHVEINLIFLGWALCKLLGESF